MPDKKKMNEFSVLSSGVAHFLDVYSQRSINGAARKNGLDAGNISRAIAKLEKTLEVGLFVRHKTGLSPTHLGEQFHSAVVEAQNAFSRKLSSTALNSRRIRVGFHSTIAYSHFSTSVIQALIDQNLEPEFTIAPSIHLIEMIKRRELDFVLSHNSVKFPGLVVRPLPSVGLILCSKTGKQKPTLLLHPDMLGFEKIIQSFAYEKRWFLRDYFLIGKMLERSELLMGLIPETLLESYSSLRAIKKLPKEGRITAISWPGSVGIELMKCISK
jgi:DNA-binding transcriptional LysR family regulator